MLLVSSIKRYFSLRSATLLLSVAIFIASVFAGAYLYFYKEVVITDGDRTSTFLTMKNAVGDVLIEQGISLRKEDIVAPLPEEALMWGGVNSISIERAVPVEINADGGKIELWTCSDTVGEVLAQGDISLGELDRIEKYKVSDQVTPDIMIKITRVEKGIVTETIALPFKIFTRENDRMDVGKEVVIREGKEGEKQKLFEAVFEDGREILRKLTSEVIVAEPINKLIEFGTVLTHNSARGGVIRYEKVLSMRATAYTASFKDTGKSPGDPGFGITYKGTKARKGVIAVDPKVIPLGTRVYIEVAGKTPDYGFAVAEDIGGAIKNNLIDIYLDDQGTVDNWGCKKVKVYILKD